MWLCMSWYKIKKRCHAPIQDRVEYVVEHAPDCICTETQLALESDSLHWGPLLGPDPVHEVPEPLSLFRDFSDSLIEELPLSVFGYPVKSNPVVFGIHLQGNAFGTSTILRPPGF